MSILNYINDLNEIVYQVEYELNDISNKNCIVYRTELLRSLGSLKNSISFFEKARDILLNDDTLNITEFLEKY